MTADIKTITFETGTAGPKLLVLGAIHGDEICGTAAIGRLVVELNAGIFSLTKGTLTVAPICNPAAYRANMRYMDANLNRVMRKHDDAALNEHKLANEVTALIDDCDILLDLHSYRGGTRPFLFLDYETPDFRAYAQALDIPYWVAGWKDIYADAQDLNDGDTVSYAQSVGKLATLVECGLHEDPAAVYAGYKAIRAALAHFGMAEPYVKDEARAPSIARLSKVVAKKADGTFTKDWQHLDAISEGDVIATYADGEALKAPHDGVLILPNARAKVGDEWFYMGRIEN